MLENMPQLKTLEENHRGRDFIVGDLHGCYQDLMHSLDCQNFDPIADRVISVGDLIDRGPDSHSCLSLTKEPWFHSVWGNHEAMMLDALSSHPGSEAFRLWMQNGGEWALEFDLDNLKIQITQMAQTTPLAIQLSLENVNVGVVHAEVPRNQWSSWKSQLSSEEMQLAVWSRSTILKSQYGIEVPPVDGTDFVIFGHTQLRFPTRIANRFFIDTGAGYSKGKVTVATIDSLISPLEFHGPELFQND